MKDRTVKALRDELLAAAEEYYRQSEHGGPDPNLAGARMRIAAKVWGRAKEEVETAARCSIAQIRQVRPFDPIVDAELVEMGEARKVGAT